MVTIQEIKANSAIKDYMLIGNRYIGNIGAIEHDLKHAEKVSDLCAEIISRLGYPARDVELAAIAGYLHDIGNLINRYGHGLSGAIMVFSILLDLKMDPVEIAIIMGAIGNHEEHAQGKPIHNVAAALILADKSDVHRSRVRKTDFATFTARDRVNYAVFESCLSVDTEKLLIILKIQIDINVCSVMEYFEIFLTKMLMCKRSARYLNCEFELIINENRML